jgi:hypothetical protein
VQCNFGERDGMVLPTYRQVSAGSRQPFVLYARPQPCGLDELPAGCAVQPELQVCLTCRACRQWSSGPALQNTAADQRVPGRVVKPVVGDSQTAAA